MSKVILDEKTAFEIGGALQRLAELDQKAIIETTDAAEKRGLLQFVGDKMVKHAQELMGCWFTVRNQYRPLVQGFAALMLNSMNQIDQSKKPAENPAETK